MFPITDLNITHSNCTDYDVQLVNGPSLNEGRVLICINGILGTLCNSGIDYNVVRMICLDLGYQRSWLIIVINLLVFLLF